MMNSIMQLPAVGLAFLNLNECEIFFSMQNPECVKCHLSLKWIITSVQNLILKYSNIYQLYLKIIFVFNKPT